MNVTFYTFSKRRNSTAQPTGGTSYTCVLKDATSTSRPSISLKWQGGGSPAAYNYAYIADFRRYYWVNGWTYDERQWTADCVVDVLATYKSAIGGSTKYVLRAQMDFDPYAPENKYMPLEPVSVGNWACTGLAFAKTFDGGRFVVGVIGQGNSFNVGGVGYYVLDSAGLQNLISACFTQSMAVWTGSTSLGPSIGEALQKYGENMEKSLANPVQFINSICWVPFTPATSGTSNIWLGNINSGVSGGKLSDPVYTQSFTASCNQWNSGTYAWPNLEPFMRFVLHVPPFPDIDVPAEFMLPSTLSLQGTGSISGTVRTDVTNGLAILTVNDSGGYGLLSASAQLGIMINLAGSSVDYAGQIKAAASTVQSGIGALFNPAGAIAGVTSGIIGFAEASQPKAKSGGYSGGMAALSSYYYEGSLIQYIYPVPELAGDEVGYPLLKNKKISDLSGGFVQCADGEITCSATDAEHRELETFLTGGFFYE